MTINEVIDRIDRQKPNTFQFAEKVAWLSTVEGLIKTQIVDTHEGAERYPFTGYDENTDRNTVLIAAPPYDELYLRYLEMQMDYVNGEMAKYNNSLAMYTQLYEDFAGHYNRTNKPKVHKFRYF